MGRLFVPSEDLIDAPWLLGNEELEELDELVKNIALRLEVASKKKHENINEQQLAPTSVKVSLISSDKKNLEDFSIKGILKDIKAKDFSPKQLYIKIENAPNENEFRLVVTAGYEGNLEYQLKCHDEEDELEIKYELDKWINKYKPKKVVQYWLGFTPIIWIVGLLTIFALWANLYDSSTNYGNKLGEKVLVLIEKGVDSSNIDEAVNLILQKEFDYRPKGFIIVETLNFENLKNLIRIILIFILLIFCPRSVIGIGKGAWKVTFYKFWLKLTLGLIPISIIFPKLVDLFTKYLL